MITTVAIPKTSTTPMPEKSSQGETMLGIPAETVQAWSNAAYIIAIAIAAVLTFLIYQSSALVVSDKERQLERYKSDAQQQVAAAQTEAELAKSNAALANERAAQLELRAAELEKETADVKARTVGLQNETEAAKASAEQARAEQERLKIDLTREQMARLDFESQFAWRTIPANVHDKLIALLAIKPGTMQIGFVAADPESTFLALQLQQIFSAAKWQTSLSANTYPGQILVGIFVPDTGDAETEQARAALKSVGILFSTGNAPAQAMSFGSTDSSKPLIVVGSKPTPTILNLIQSMNARPP
jgi:hypothetical protein